MQDTLRPLPPLGRARSLPHVVDPRFRPSREGALREAHASLQAAHENLLHLAASPAARPGNRPPLFRRR